LHALPFNFAASQKTLPTFPQKEVSRRLQNMLPQGAGATSALKAAVVLAARNNAASSGEFAAQFGALSSMAQQSKASLDRIVQGVLRWAAVGKSHVQAAASAPVSAEGKAICRMYATHAKALGALSAAHSLRMVSSQGHISRRAVTQAWHQTRRSCTR